MVVLFTNANYSGGDTRGGAGTVSLEYARSYCIVEIWAATANKTFPHEVGHLFGCRHDNHPGSPDYAQGYNIKNGIWVTDRTMMSTHTADGSNRLMNFSNPSKSVGGKATGTVNFANNARRINETCTTVQNFQPNPPGSFNVYLEGSTYVTYEGARTYELVYKCGAGPYTFAWAYSLDGVNYVPTGSNSETLNWYFHESQTLYLRGTITNNGQSYNAFTTVDVQIPNGSRTSSESKLMEKDDIIVSPNPGYDKIAISYQIDKRSQAKVEILDLNGRVLTSLKKTTSKMEVGTYTTIWDVTDVQAGTYLCRVVTNNAVRTKKIAVLKH